MVFLVSHNFCLNLAQAMIIGSRQMRQTSPNALDLPNPLIY